MIDITDRLVAEEFRSVVMDNMAEGLYALDGEGRLRMMNAAASKMLGWSEDKLRGKLMHDAIHFQHADGSRVSSGQVRFVEGCGREPRHPRGR